MNKGLDLGLEMCLVYSGSGAAEGLTQAVEREAWAGSWRASSAPAAGRVLDTLPPPRRCSGRPADAVLHTCGAAHGLCLRTRSLSLAFKGALKTRPTQSESEAGAQQRACAQGGGRRGWAVGEGAGGGVGGICGEALPGSS